MFPNVLPAEPTAQEVNDHYGGIGLKTSYTMFVYGIDDPWQGAEMMALQDPNNAHRDHIAVIVADCDSCAHCIDLHQDNEANPTGLQKAHTEMRELLLQWFHELDQPIAQSLLSE